MKRNQKFKRLISKKFDRLTKWTGWHFWPMPFGLTMTALGFQFGLLPGAFMLAITTGLYFSCRPLKELA